MAVRPGFMRRRPALIPILLFFIGVFCLSCRREGPGRGPESGARPDGRTPDVYSIDENNLVNVWGDIDCPEYAGGNLYVFAIGTDGVIYDKTIVDQLDQWEVSAPKGSVFNLIGFWDKNGDAKQDAEKGDVTLVNRQNPVQAEEAAATPLRLSCMKDVFPPAALPEKASERSAVLISGTIDCPGFEGSAVVMAVDDRGTEYAKTLVVDSPEWRLLVPTKTDLFLTGFWDKNRSGQTVAPDDGDLFFDFPKNPIKLSKENAPSIRLTCAAKPPAFAWSFKDRPNSGGPPHEGLDVPRGKETSQTVVLTGSIDCAGWKDGFAVVEALDEKNVRFSRTYLSRAGKWSLPIPMKEPMFIAGFWDKNRSGPRKPPDAGDVFFNFDRNPIRLEKMENPPIVLTCGERPPLLHLRETEGSRTAAKGVLLRGTIDCPGEKGLASVEVRTDKGEIVGSAEPGAARDWTLDLPLYHRLFVAGVLNPDGAGLKAGKGNDIPLVFEDNPLYFQKGDEPAPIRLKCVERKGNGDAGRANAKDVVQISGTVECPEARGGRIVVGVSDEKGRPVSAPYLGEASGWSVSAPKNTKVNLTGFWDLDGNGDAERGEPRLAHPDNPIAAGSSSMFGLTLVCRKWPGR